MNQFADLAEFKFKDIKDNYKSAIEHVFEEPLSDIQETELKEEDKRLLQQLLLQIFLSPKKEEEKKVEEWKV